MQWFRMYGDFVNDPKMVGISRDARLLFVELCCLATSHGDGSGSTNHTPKQAMTALRIHYKTFKAALITLQEIGVCNVNDSGVIVLTNWQKRQFSSDSSAKRTQKYREKNRFVTSQERHSDALDTDTDIKNIKKENHNAQRTVIEVGAVSLSKKVRKEKPAEPDGFDEFWKTYPQYKGRSVRAVAVTAYSARLKEGASVDDMLAAARNYAASPDALQEGGKYAPACHRWLSSGKWQAWVPEATSTSTPAPVGLNRATLTPDQQRLYDQLIEYA